MTTHLGSSAPARVETISVTEAIGGRAALTAPAPNAQACAAEALTGIEPIPVQIGGRRASAAGVPLTLCDRFLALVWRRANGVLGGCRGDGRHGTARLGPPGEHGPVACLRRGAGFVVENQLFPDRGRGRGQVLGMVAEDNRADDLAVG